MREIDLRLLFARFWLPAYLLLGVSWLLAPALAHEHYNMLQLISNEEARKGIAGVLFRLGDVAAATLLFGAALSFRIGRQTAWFGKAIVVVAVLSAIDGFFPDTCYVGHASCSIVAAGISSVHDVETLLLTVVIAALSLADTLRLRQLASVAFVGIQLAVALLLVAGVGSRHFQALLQYIYETALIFWIGWLVDRYNPLPQPGHDRIRRVVAYWVMAAGVFALVTAFPHVHFVRQWHDWGSGMVGVALEQHGIIAGVLALYIGRHLLRGERPALWLALAVFYTQIIKYSLLTPQLTGLVLYTVLAVLLLYTRHGFNRNTAPPSWSSRVSDVAVVFGGVLLATLAVLVVVTLSGNRTRLNNDVLHTYDRPYHALDRRKHDLSRYRERRLRVLGVTLAASVGAVTLWSLFRPKSLKQSSNTSDEYRRFERLLRRYGTSSEDHFKLWPAGKQYFFAPGMVGAIAYRVEAGIVFMLADPVAPSEAARLRLLEAFIGFTRSHGLVLGVLVVGAAAPDLYERVGLQVRQIGSSAVIDVQTFAETTMRTKWWRWQHNRAMRQGWRHEKLVPPHSRPTMQELAAVSEAWLRHNRRSEQGFALGYFDEPYLQACAVHVLRDEAGAVVAFANELPLYGQVRQVSVDLIRYLPGADGAMPALLQGIIASLQGTAYRTFDLGFVPLAKTDSELARLIRLLGRNRFSAAGLEQFKNKFDPAWRPDYIAYDGDLIDLARIASNLERLFKVELPPHGRVQ